MSYRVQSVAAALIQKAANDLIAAVKATPDERINWRPLPEARPILPQLVECCLANRMWANILQTRAHTVLPEGEATKAYKEIDSAVKAVEYIQETSDRVAEVIRNIPDTDLSAIVPFPWDTQRGIPIAECCFHTYWNLSYHLGQISYIQTLYGDNEEHGDAGPFGEQ